MGGRPQRGHPYIVHRGDARPNHGAALNWSLIPVRDKHPEPDGSYRGQERNRGQTGIVAYGKTRLKGQLGNEIGRPHAGAEDRGRHEQPWKGPVPLRVIGANEKIHGYQANGNANQCGEEDEPEITLFGQDRHIRAASFNHTCVRIAVPAPLAPDSENRLDNGSDKPPTPRHFSTVLPANVSRVGCVLLFRNGQVLFCWPIEPPAGPIQGSEPGLTTLNACRKI